MLDLRFAGTSDENRWNDVGDRTLYCASDVGIALAQFGRHFRADRPPRVGRPALAQQTVERQFFRLSVMAELLDLRGQDVLSALSLKHAPRCFMSLAYARATARFIRTTTRAQGILVPPMAALDDAEHRWVLVLFLERLPADPHAFITSVASDVMLRIEAG